MKFALLCLALMVSGAPLHSVELSWNDYVEYARSSANGAGKAVVYLGGRTGVMARVMQAGSVDQRSIPLVYCDGAVESIAPVSNTTIQGYKLWAMYGAVAGQLLIVDENGLPIPGAGLPSGVHGHNPVLINAFFHYAASDMSERLTFLEFCEATGAGNALASALARWKDGFNGRFIQPEEPIMNLANLDGQSIDMRKEPGVFFIFCGDPSGDAAVSQVADLWAAFGHMNVQMTIVVPEGSLPQTGRLMALGVPAVLAFGSQEEVLSGPTPRTLVFENRRNMGFEVWGYTPPDVWGTKFGIVMAQTYRPFQVNMPMGSLDTGSLDAAFTATAQRPQMDPLFKPE